MLREINRGLLNNQGYAYVLTE
ncbi:Protein of unknown function [Bacillus wiedmannii]|nr:Protein of unknown function [Bacillus wiedmannii]